VVGGLSDGWRRGIGSDGCGVAANDSVMLVNDLRGWRGRLVVAAQ
jgi:hypothetical protein